MTLIEFYDANPINNIVAPLTERPDRIVYLGEKGKMTNDRQNHLRLFLEEECGFDCPIFFRETKPDDLGDLIRILIGVVTDNPEVGFDLTGGNDLALVAVGYVCGLFRQNAFPIFHYNVEKREVYDARGANLRILNDEGIPVPSSSAKVRPISARISPKQLIRLHGGSIVYDQKAPFYTKKWNFSQDFIGDIKRSWEVCRQDPGQWNRQITTIKEIIARRIPSSDPLTVDTDLGTLSHHADLGGIFSGLKREGLITEMYLRPGTNICHLTFKNEQVMELLRKEGNCLELMVLVAGMEATLRGQKVFTDYETGVVIDWDGVVHFPGESIIDTSNEIDDILMRGFIPCFVSCKNGSIKEDELYKLSTVASRFGGSLSEKYLVATTLGSNPDARDALLQRARDMNVNMICGVHKWSADEFGDRFAQHL